MEQEDNQLLVHFDLLLGRWSTNMNIDEWQVVDMLFVVSKQLLYSYGVQI